MNIKIKIKLNEISKINKFIKEIMSFESDVDIISGKYICNAKSLLGIFSLDLSNPVVVEIHSNNKEEITRFNKVLEEFIYE